jgi:acyl-coenzyme A synthetase/AMP-(fatty) acid ligase
VVPERVEQVLRQHPDVADAAVVGRPDPEWQEAVTAVVVAGNANDLSADVLRAWCRERLAGHEVPKRFEWASELPRTASGKLKRAELRG